MADLPQINIPPGEAPEVTQTRKARSPSDHDGLREDIFAALYAAERPLTADVALSIAKTGLPAPLYEQFAKWFRTNGEQLLRNING